jgi:hypothetical protein
MAFDEPKAEVLPALPKAERVPAEDDDPTVRVPPKMLEACAWTQETPTNCRPRARIRYLNAWVGCWVRMRLLTPEPWLGFGTPGSEGRGTDDPLHVAPPGGQLGTVPCIGPSL